MQTLRKVIALSVIFVTVLSMSVVVAPEAKAAASAGDLIKMNGLSSVYYLGGDGKRYVFPNEQTYFSWYSDFSSVMTIPQAELESYPLGANVTIRPGTKLVKITTNPKVYAVEPGGSLVAIPDEATAKALFGDNWAKRIVDVPDAFFTNYKIASKTLTSAAYPTGSLIKLAGAPEVYYIDVTGAARKIASESAFNANRFKWSDIVTAAALPATMGTEITVADATITDTSSGAGGTVYTGGTGVTVSLSGMTPGSTTVVSGQALADVAAFNFTASNDGAIKVTSLKLKRLGISGDSTLSNVYLFDGVTRLTDGSSMSSGVVTFSDGAGLVTVPAGQSKTITVKADIATGLTSGTFGLGIAAATDVVAGGATISGTFPANGNLMSVAAPDSATLGTATLTAVPTSVGSSVNAGTNQTILWSAPITVGVKYANLKTLSLKQIGSAPYDAIQNFKLFVDGVQAGNAVSTAATDGTVTFDVTSVAPKMEVGAHTVEVRGDVVKGSSRTFQFSLQTAADIVITESGYGINVTLATSGTGAIPAKPAAATTISAGSLSISTDTSLNTTQVVKSTSNVALARYTVKAYGEDMKVMTANVLTTVAGTSTATEGLSNIAIFVNGAQVGSSRNAVVSTTTVGATATSTFGTTNLFTVRANETVTVEIRADLTQVASSQITTVDANLQILANSVQGVSSAQTWPTATQNYSGQNALTVVTGALTVSKATDFQNQIVLANTSKVKVGAFKLQAGNAEDVNITSLAIGLATSTASTNDMTNLYVTYDGVTTDPVQPQATNNFTANFTVPANNFKTVSVYVDLGSNIAAGSTTVTYLTVNYRGAKTNTTNTGSVQGQTITIQNGSLAAPTLIATDPSSALVAGGTTAKAATYKFVATNGTAYIQEMWFNVTDVATTTANGTTTNSVTVAGQSAPVVFDGTNYVAKITGLNIAVAPGTTGVNIPVNVTYNTVTSAGQGGAPTRSAARLNLVYYKSQIANTVGESNTNVASNVMYVVASVPTVTLASNNTAGVANGYVGGPNSEVMRFTVTAPAGQPINLKKVGFTPVYAGLTSSTQLVKIYAEDNTTTALNAAGTAVGNSGTQGTVTFDEDYFIAGGTSKTFVVKADTTGVNADGESFRFDLTASNDTAVSTGTDWGWNDTTVATYGNGFLLKNLSLNGNTFNN